MAALRLERLDHVSLNVAERPASIALYGDVLGLEQRNEPTQDDWPVFMGEFRPVRRSLPRPRSSRQCAHTSRPVCATWPSCSVGGLERAQEHVQGRGAEFRFDDHGSALALYLADPDGNVVELTTCER